MLIAGAASYGFSMAGHLLRFTSTLCEEPYPMFTELIEYMSRHLAEKVVDFYKDRLVSLLLFGSVGRGTLNQYSDIDMLLVADRLPKGRMRRIEEFIAVENQLESNLQSMQKQGWQTYLSPVIKTPEEVLQGSFLFLDMIDDSKILFDRDNFICEYLHSLNERLAEYGAVKVQWKGGWYWNLKPDFKPGDVVSL